MAFKGKLAGVDGRKLLFGDKGYVDDDGTFVKLKKGEALPFGKVIRHEREFTMSPDCAIKRGEWPDWDACNRSDLATGQEVRVCGVAGNAAEGICHTVCILAKPSHKNATFARQLAAERKAEKAKAAKPAKASAGK